MPTDDDGMSANFFLRDPDAPVSSEPPPPAGEDDYGENVVTFPERGTAKKRGRAEWAKDWQLSDNGAPLPNLFNVALTLRNHPKLADMIRYDDMARTPMLMRQIPNTTDDPSIPRPLRDADVLAIQEEIQVAGLRRIGKPTVQDAIELIAAQARYHPVRDYLNGLVWDGTQRVTGWLGRYLGVEGNAYSDTIGRLFLVALIARQFRPGCKADYMLILEGPQGAMKSSACRVLAGEWFSDNLPDLYRGDPVRLSMHLRGKWLIEIAELSSFNAAESHTLKEFVTQTEERYTPKYGRQEVHEARQCLFIGTTNEKAYLRDATGARRFWPVRVGTILTDDLTADRDQLLAEAVHLYREGAQWWPDRDFEREHIAPEQAARFEEDVWQAQIHDWLAGGATVDEFGYHHNRPRIDRTTVNDVLLGPIGLKVSQFGTREQRRVSSIFRHMGWEQVRTSGKTYFTRPEASNAR